MNYQRSKTAVIISGILAVLLGLILISVPGIAIATFILLFAVYLILYGAVRIVSSLGAPQGSTYRLPWLIVGIIAILGGVGLIIYPSISITLLAIYIGLYAIMIGVLELIGGFRIKGHLGWEILAIIAGALSVLFGVYLFIYPTVGLSLLILFLGWYSLIYGILIIIYGFMNKPLQPSY